MSRPQALPILALTLLAAPLLAQDGAAPKTAEPASAQKERRARAWLQPFKDAREQHEKALKAAKSKGAEQLKAARLTWLDALRAEEKRAAAAEAEPGPIAELARDRRRAVQLQRLRLLLFLLANEDNQGPKSGLAAERRALEAAIDADANIRAAGRRLRLIEARGREPRRYRALLAEALEARGRIKARSGADLTLKELEGAPALLWFWSPGRPRSLDGAAAAAEALARAGGLLVLVALEPGGEAKVAGARALTAADPELARDLAITAPPLTLLFDADGALRLVDPGPVGLARALASLGSRDE